LEVRASQTACLRTVSCSQLYHHSHQHHHHQHRLHHHHHLLHNHYRRRHHQHQHQHPHHHPHHRLSEIADHPAATGLCVDARGKVLVNSDGRTQVFDRAGRHITTFTPASLLSSVTWGDLYGVVVDRDGRLLICSQVTNSLVRLL
jgi:hypothetical protein